MNSRFCLALFLSIIACSRSFAETTNNSKARPANWAVPIARSGLPNCFQLTTNFYRGAQPTAEGMTALKTMGIKTIINLRTFHSDERKLSNMNLQSQRLKLEPWHVNDTDAVSFLKILADTNSYPIFVHCERGADRTGTMCALYRIAVCGWSKSEAIQEMKSGDFGFNPAWQNLVNYLEHADVENLMRRAGLVEAKLSQNKKAR